MSAAARSDRNLGLGCLVIAFLVALAISWRSVSAVRRQSAVFIEPPTTEGISGFPSAVDPISLMSHARRLTERRQLQGWFATGVKSDGKLDLTHRASGARFEFDSLPGAGPQPKPLHGIEVTGTFCGRQTIQLTGKGLYADPDRARAVCRSRRPPALPEPGCTLTQIWQAGLQRGARPQEKAVIEYFRAKRTAAWKFTIPGSNVRFVLASDCVSELRGLDAIKY